ncbi:RagB/SusD family nutrient uptake outer membrane protein [Niabella pedocola]|uniref:RagB/SusD family nutrient uptake outer membrane protein n=1 Tax=Niabella pedocola TaxID=1752077 RepID=A0ABS8PXN7_9BACT|nr:RagB/SusD family nutrient uptake outer membrane protein [Niabella pedocola]MCD2425108.1 RagB/SusD family nutrient uptake outer membrane protein [Niabella pedocola]
MKKYLIIILHVVLLVLGSCSKDFLQRPPLTRIENGAYWKTANDLGNYTLQFYSRFPSFDIVGSYMGLIGWDGTRGSDVQITSSPSTLWNGASTVVASASPIANIANGETPGPNWNWQYIRSINVFFSNYQKCGDPFEKYKHFLGEAHFFKAWFYFEKVKQYGDVPWYTEPMVTESEELYKARSPRTEVVDSILWHLDKAIEYLTPLKDAGSIGGNNRLSKEAALLFKSRVALYEGTWQKYHKGTAFGTAGADPNKYLRAAANAAEELMAPTYGRSLYSNNEPANDYCRLFSLTNQANNKEVILWKAYSVGLSLSHSFQIYVSDRTAGISMTLQQVYNYLDKSGNVYDYFNIGKAVKGSAFLTKIATDCDPRLAQTIWTPGGLMWDNSYGKGVFSKPFLDKSGESLNNTGFQIRKGNDPKDPQAGSGVAWNTSSETGAIVFRYAEALLNYAEAKAELGEAVDYAKSINLLRKRAGMPDFKVQSDLNKSRYADYGYAISNELFEIRREREVELGAEGFRYDDLRRWAAHNLLKDKRPKGYPLDASEWAKPISYRTDSDGFLDPYATVLPNGYGFKADRDYLECIPLNEITLNPNLKQNPGW